MIEHDSCPRLGSLILTRRLGECSMAQRWLALEESDQTSHSAYCFPARRGKAEVRRFIAAAEKVSGLERAHALKIESFCVDQGGRPWVISPFTGDSGGLVTLERLLRDKGGHMHPTEAERALEQLLEAFDDEGAGKSEAGGTGGTPIRHGPITLDQVQVDRRGRLLIELFGLKQQLSGSGFIESEMIRDEIRSVVEIGYQLITGLRAEEPLIPAGRLVRKLDSAWDEWFEYGLDPSAGFESSRAALEKLPGRSSLSGTGTRVTVRRVLERIGAVRPLGI